MSAREGRSTAEWTSFAVCSAILLVVLGLLASELAGPEDPPTPTVSVSEARQELGSFFVPVEVHNEGDETALDVQVSASLTVGGTTEMGDVVVGFLGGGESEEVVFAFAEDPADGELEVRVTSFAVP